MTVHNHIYFIFSNSNNSYWKYKKLQNKQTSNSCNLHTHTHAYCSDVWTDFICSEMLLIPCIWFRYTELSTRRKKLIMFSKDMAVVIYNHPSLPYHTSRWSYIENKKRNKHRYSHNIFFRDSTVISSAALNLLWKKKGRGVITACVNSCTHAYHGSKRYFSNEASPMMMWKMLPANTSG